MATQFTSPVSWQRSSLSPAIFGISQTACEDEIFSPILTTVPVNTSFLHSHKLRDSILESRKAFLSLSLQDQKAEEEEMEEKSIILGQHEAKKVPPTKKISYKIKKQPSLHKKVQKNSSSKVAELTKKFNELNANKSIPEESRTKKTLRRMDSQRSEDSVKIVKKPNVSRKPSVKTKPTLNNKNIVIIRTKTSGVHRKTSLKNQNGEKVCVRAKMGYLEEPLQPKQMARPNTLNIRQNNNNSILDTSPNGTSVKATIEIFERKSSPQTPKEVPKFVPKPKVPEKSLSIKSLVKNISPSSPQKVITPQIKQTHEINKSNNENTIISDDDRAKSDKTEDIEEKVQIITIPAVLPQRRCDSMYETLTLKKIQPQMKAKSEEIINRDSIKPNSSFLWKSLHTSQKLPTNIISDNIQNEEQFKISEGYSQNINSTEETYTKKAPALPPKPILNTSKSLISKDIKVEETSNTEEYEEIADVKNSEIKPLNTSVVEGYEEIGSPVESVYEELTEPVVDVSIPLEDRNKEPDKTNENLNPQGETNKGYDEVIKYNEKIISENLSPKEAEENIKKHQTMNKDYDYEPIGKTDDSDGYEFCSKRENIYETLPALTPNRQQEPLPPRPSSRGNYSIKSEGAISNIYESIYAKDETSYESIYLTETGSNRDSLLSVDQKSNSLYGKTISNWEDDRSTYKETSDLSCSDHSDEWIDVTDNEAEGESSGFVIVREKHKVKSTGWSHHFREQSSKAIVTITGTDSESEHHYESLCNQPPREEFADDDYDSFDTDTESESSFDKNDSGVDIANHQLPDPPNTQAYNLIKFAGKHMKKIKKNFAIDITKSLSRMTRRKSKPDVQYEDTTVKKEEKPTISKPSDLKIASPKTPQSAHQTEDSPQKDKQPSPDLPDDADKSKSLPRKGFLNKFRRSMSLSPESASELTNNLQKPKSTFYLTEIIDVDQVEEAEEALPDDVPVSPLRSNKTIVRPNSPPPPAPQPTNYHKSNQKEQRKTSSWYAESVVFGDVTPPPKRPNTCWYAEIGLYQPPQTILPSVTSAEDSGSTTASGDFVNQDAKLQVSTEEFYNQRNESGYYAGSVASSNSENKDESWTSVPQDIQLRLQDEPLYQFYDAAVLDSVCYDGASDFDSDNYEDVISANTISPRPTAMELVSPNKNSLAYNRTLWCEIPEVKQSAVLSTLSPHQKKLQEAKFEILTSEASYLNSLNVLTGHFVQNLNNCNLVNNEEKDILFGKIEAVRNCSERLLQDLENCWQDNILLHGICEIVQRHAEENFNVYVPFCENQILLDDTLRQIKEQPGFTEILRQLESSSVCQSLTLYSFLMLPMQRITRWPLLVDAVLKRLSHQDPEYYTCQYALATLNKIVSQCNEAARIKERETELKKIARQLIFPPNMTQIEIVTHNRWLIRSGCVIQIQPKSDDSKLTFGKRFSKTPLHFFLFNDLLVITKDKTDNTYQILHHCPRNMAELNSSELVLTIPTKEAQGRNIIFLTLLENQDGKTVEMLLTCSKESDKERWIEAFTPPKSEDPDEVLYECWDCPQVTAVHNYVASQPDELALSRGDVINVLRKMNDGWYHGERIRDGQHGWFPANHTVEIANPHVRARNLKQRYRLLALSENYLKSK